LKETTMKISAILTTAALASLFAMSASAEQYHGVLKFQSSASRAEVRSQAVVAAHSADPYSEAAFAGVAPAVTSNRDRSGARTDAVAAARAGNPYSDAAFAGVAPAQASRTDRAAVRAEARATAARGTTEGTL
jgi:hypothetical protein